MVFAQNRCHASWSPEPSRAACSFPPDICDLQPRPRERRPRSARLASRCSPVARPACSRFGEIPPFCNSDHRRGVGPV
jgi:hypothetical protein